MIGINLGFGVFAGAFALFVIALGLTVFRGM